MEGEGHYLKWTEIKFNHSNFIFKIHYTNTTTTANNNNNNKNDNDNLTLISYPASYHYSKPAKIYYYVPVLFK